MNHRYLSRAPLRRGIDVYKQHRRLGNFETRDIGLEGLYLEADSVDLEPNDIVKLRFEEACGWRRDCSLLAGVIRRDDDGVGLMFLDNDTVILDVLQDDFLLGQRQAV